MKHKRKCNKLKMMGERAGDFVKALFNSATPIRNEYLIL